MRCSSREFIVRKATLADLNDVKRVADKHRAELGFVLKSALANSIEESEVFVAVASSEIIGFAEYHHRKDLQTTLYHIAVVDTWRGFGVGRSLIFALIDEARLKNKRTICLKCPSGLNANFFYKRMEFEFTRTENGKKQELTVWSKPLGETS
jgi:predicted GNAT family acetyltransferase